MRNSSKRLFAPAPLSDSITMYLSANAVLRAAGVGRGVLLTWLMISRAEFGVYQLGLLLINILLPILSFGCYEGVARFVPQYETGGQLWLALRRMLVLCGCLATVLCGAFYLVARPFAGPLWSSASPEAISTATGSGLLELVVLNVMCLIVYHLVIAVLRGRRMFRAVSMMELAAGALFTLSAVVAGIAGCATGTLVLWLYLGTNLVVAVPFGCAALYQARAEGTHVPGTAPAGWSGVVSFSFWSGAAAFLWQLLLLLPALVLHHRCGEEALATYRAMTLLGQLSYVVPAAVSFATLAAVAKAWEDDGQGLALDLLDLATKAALAAVLVLAVLLSLLKSAIVLIFEPAYRPGAEALPLLLLLYLCAGALSFVTIRFTLLKKSRLTFLCWAPGCVVTMALCGALVDSADPAEAIVLTAMAGAVGILVALWVALILLGNLHFLPGRGVVILLVAMMILAVPRPVQLVSLVVVVGASCFTSLIFTSRQRRLLIDHVVGWFRPRPAAGGSDNL